MAKRFTDTNKYRKSFIRELQGAYKLLWDYLYHECDHAGIWHKDFEIAQIYLGKDMPVNEEAALTFFNKGDVRIIPYDNDKKWFIPSFIEFQYGLLNSQNRAHNSVINILKKEGLYKDNKLLVSPLQEAKDKDKDKVKVKDKDKVKHKYGEYKNVLLTDGEVEKLKKKYGGNINQCIRNLDEGIEQKGYKYKSHYLTILKWFPDIGKGKSDGAMFFCHECETQHRYIDNKKVCPNKGK